MAWELELILRFDDEYPPSRDDIEAALDCIVIEIVGNEV